MNAEIWHVSVNEALRLFPNAPVRLLEFMTKSHPLRAGIYNNEPVCLMGLCPLTSTTAYLWGWNTPTIAQHRIAYGRWAKRTVKELCETYPTIVGHCLPTKCQWLTSLGASLGSFDEPLGMFNFTIKARPHAQL